METILVILGVAAVIMVVVMIAQSQAKEQAKQAYRAALEHLKMHPADPRAREDALAKGRIYSNMTRNGPGVAIYDEMAIKNDLDAACAAHAAGPPVRGHFDVPRVNGSLNFGVDEPAAKLQRIKELHQRGLISDEEFSQKKAEVLASL
ncbi:MAG TPA: SHOCT domain-containing protein [Fimbriimonadaceae bacterium]|nr:SHOCT domain-containing protein [Fimbriimonadaceae bacterium]